MWTCTTFLLCTWSVPLRWHHSRPMTMTSTTSPLCNSTYCSVFGGNIRRPLALRMLISRLLIWFPVEQSRVLLAFLHTKKLVICKLYIHSICCMPYKYIYISNYVYLCSVPREVVPGGAMSVYSDDILDVDPTLHHRTAAKKSTHTDDVAAETQCKSQESSGGWSKLLKYWGKSTNTIIIHYSSKSIFLFNFT